MQTKNKPGTLLWRRKQRRKGGLLGVSTKKKVTAAWNILLARNVYDQKTDAKLMELMRLEFPLRKTFQPIGKVRSMYNRGVLGYGRPGVNLRNTAGESLAYDADGNIAVHSDWGRRLKKWDHPRRKKRPKQ